MNPKTRLKSMQSTFLWIFCLENRFSKCRQKKKKTTVKHKRILSLVEPNGFIAFSLQSRHYHIDIIIAKSKHRSMWIDPFIGWQFLTNFVQLIFRECSALCKRKRKKKWNIFCLVILHNINKTQMWPSPWNRLLSACNAHNSRICRSWYIWLILMKLK